MNRAAQSIRSTLAGFKGPTSKAGEGKGGRGDKGGRSEKGRRDGKGRVESGGVGRGGKGREALLFNP